MANKFQKYSNGKKDKRKAVIAVILMILSVVLIAGIVAAFYSDVVWKSTDITSGTLKINGTYKFYRNGSEVQLENIKNLNPGDVIVVKGDISNTGSQSAWVRDKIIFDASDNVVLPYIKVYAGEFTQEELISDTGLNQYIVPFITEGQAVTANRVINGSGTDAETESGTDYDYIDSSSYQIVFSVYFMHSAGNETQAKSFGMTVSTQALQFRNNNSAEPDENAWAAVNAVR